MGGSVTESIEPIRSEPAEVKVKEGRLWVRRGLPNNLVGVIRTHKTELLKQIQDTELRSAAKQACARLNQGWLEGTLAWARQQQLQLYCAAKEVEDRLEAAWRDILGGHGDAAEFYRQLDEWERLHQRMIELRKLKEENQ